MLARDMHRRETRDIEVAFPTALGWFALAGSGQTVRRLTLGHRSASAARRAIHAPVREAAVVPEWAERLIERLRAYAAGQPDDFRDVRVDLGTRTPFQRLVLGRCREIGYGQRRTYGQLAAACGCPRGARAVGRSMACNPVPIIVPCHRVVGSAGSLGGYSAPGGVGLKRRLLELEAGGRLWRGRGGHIMRAFGPGSDAREDELP